MLLKPLHYKIVDLQRLSRHQVISIALIYYQDMQIARYEIIELFGPHEVPTSDEVDAVHNTAVNTAQKYLSEYAATS